MAQLRHHTKIKAATLLEVIVAMVVIMIVFTLATGIFANIIKSSPSVKQHHVNALLAQVIAESITKQNWKDETITVDSMILQKTVKPYQDYADLLQIQVVATERGQEIAALNQIVKAKIDEAEQ